MRGFTLIELLVAISLSLLLTGGVIASYSSFNNSQKLKQAALTLKNNLRFIANKAISGEKPANCVRLRGLEVSFTDTSYSWETICDPEIARTPVLLAQLPSAVTFSPRPQTLLFSSVDGRASEPQRITIIDDKSQSTQVSVYGTGAIGDGDFAPTPTVLPGQGASGDGLLGQYYNDLFPDANIVGEPRLTRVDDEVNFNWARGSPHPFIDADTFTVKWTGYIKAPYSGQYLFTVQSDDGFQLKVDNKSLSTRGHWTNGGKRLNAWVTLVAQKPTPITISMYEYTNNGYIYLYWQKPRARNDPITVPYQIIPKAYLYSE